MKLACIVLAHHLPDQLARLLSVLRHPQVRVYLHINRRKRLRPFTRRLAEAGLEDIKLLRRHPSRWGSAETVDAILEGISAGVADRCDYFTLISGQDFPLRSADDIVAFFEGVGDKSYIHHWPLSLSLGTTGKVASGPTSTPSRSAASGRSASRAVRT